MLWEDCFGNLTRIIIMMIPSHLGPLSILTYFILGVGVCGSNNVYTYVSKG